MKRRAEIISDYNTLFVFEKVHVYFRDRMLFPRIMTTTDERKVMFLTLLYNGFDREGALNIITTFVAKMREDELTGYYLTPDQLLSLTNYVDRIIHKHPGVLSPIPDQRTAALIACSYRMPKFYDFARHRYIMVNTSIASPEDRAEDDRRYERERLSWAERGVTRDEEREWREEEEAHRIHLRDNYPERFKEEYGYSP